MFRTYATHGASPLSLIYEDDEEKKRKFAALEIQLYDFKAFELLNIINSASLLTFYYVICSLSCLNAKINSSIIFLLICDFIRKR